MADVKTDLVAEINRTMETLGAIELTDEQYSEGADNVTKLLNKMIDLEKIETDRAKVELERAKLELEEKKVASDCGNNSIRAEAENAKVEVERSKLTLEERKLCAENEYRKEQSKDSKIDRWINIGLTAGLGLIGLGVQVWANKSAMNYEVTGHYPTTESGRNSQKKLLNWKF